MEEKEQYSVPSLKKVGTVRELTQGQVKGLGTEDGYGSYTGEAG
jgi:hypothetical protein